MYKRQSLDKYYIFHTIQNIRTHLGGLGSVSSKVVATFQAAAYALTERVSDKFICLLGKSVWRNAMLTSGGFVRIWVVFYSKPAVICNNMFLLSVKFLSLTCISNGCLVRLCTSPIACTASTVRMWIVL